MDKKNDELLKQIIEALKPLIQAEVEKVLAAKERDKEPDWTAHESFKTRMVSKDGK
jgi:translation initiation factor IF-2